MTDTDRESPLLDVRDVHVAYGAGVLALQGVSLQVRPGKSWPSSGANGAGKTTLLKTIAGLVPARSGDIRFAGGTIADVEAPDRIKLGPGLVPEGRRLFSRLTVADNLSLGTFTNADPAAPAGDARPDLHALSHPPGARAQRAGTLSGGEGQMLAIARALMSRPRFLMLDEPSLGIMPRLVDSILEALAQLHRAEGLAMFLVEQNVPAALGAGDPGLRAPDGAGGAGGEQPRAARQRARAPGLSGDLTKEVTMPFDPRFMIDVMYPAATSAYLMMTVHAPPLPAGYTLVGAIEADPRAAVTVAGLTDAKLHEIARGHALGEQGVRTRGLERRGEDGAGGFSRHAVDLGLDQRPGCHRHRLLAVAGSGHVHMGFQLVYAARAPERGQAARRLHGRAADPRDGAQPGRRRGHPVRLRARKEHRCPHRALHSGRPAHGRPDFSGAYSGVIPICYRVVNFMDVVPQVPLPPLYKHAGEEVLVRGGFKPLEVAYAHRLTTYLAGLQKLLP